MTHLVNGAYNGYSCAYGIGTFEDGLLYLREEK
jgi:hypothetical protein